MSVEQQLAEQKQKIEALQARLKLLEQAEYFLKKQEVHAAFWRRANSYLGLFAVGLFGAILLALVNGEFVNGEFSYQYHEASSTQVLDLLSKLLVVGSTGSVIGVATGAIIHDRQKK